MVHADTEGLLLEVHLHHLQSNTLTPQSPDLGRVEALDLLRFAAVFGVACYHFCFFGPEINGKPFVAFPAWADMAKYGYLGVQLFFVISGFVIAYSAVGRSASAFAIARFSRIYPAFLFCMTLTFLVTLAFGGEYFQAPLTQWVANLFIVAPVLRQPYVDGVYWTLILELTFYGWIYAMLLSGVFPKYILQAVVVWFAISLSNEVWIGSHLIRKLFLTDQSGFFASGLLIFEISRGRNGLAVQSLLGYAAVLAVFQAVRHVQEMHDLTGASFDAMIVAALALGTVAVTVLAARVRRLPIASHVTRLIGGITYPLYLLHQMIGYVAFLLLSPMIAPGPLLAAIAGFILIGSWAVWHFIDRPGQKSAKRLLTGFADQRHPSGFWQKALKFRNDRRDSDLLMPERRIRCGISEQLS